MQVVRTVTGGNAKGGPADLDGGITVLPKAGAAAAKGKRKAAPADAGGARKKTVPIEAVRAAYRAHD